MFMDKLQKTNEEEKVLLVGKATSPGALRTAAVGHLRKGKVVHLDCIGVAANYVATKTIIMIRAFLSTMGYELEYTPIYKDYILKDSEDRIKTGIRWTLTIKH